MTATLQEQCLIRYRWSAKWCAADLAAQRYTSSSLSRGGEGCGEVSQQRTATFAMEKLSTAEEKGGPKNLHDTEGGGQDLALIVKALWLLGQPQPTTEPQKCYSHLPAFVDFDSHNFVLQ